MNQITFIKLIKTSAWYDLFVTWVLTIPITSIFLIDFLNIIHSDFWLAHSFWSFDPIHMIFVNMLGAVSFFWAILRIKHASRLLWYYDAVIRLVLAGIILFYLCYYNISLLLLSFFFTEIIFGFLQITFFYKTKK